jgi:putative spermidine/putrescine transport system permease protein
MDRPVTSVLLLPGRRAWRERNHALAVALLAAPALLFTALLFLYPLWSLIGLSFDLPHFRVDYYQRFITSAYVETALRTLAVCVFITGCCLVLGYPTALFLSKATRRGHGYLLALVVFPYLTSLLVRTYAWMVLLSDAGPINSVLLATGVVSHPVKLLFSTTGAMIGMVHLTLPLMILPIYSVMYGIPDTQMRAASALGGGPVRAFVKIFWPQTLPGIRSGCTLVFAISLGFYITPAALGSPRDTMLSNLVASLIGGALDFKFAAAISVAMLAVTLLFYFLAGGGLGSLRQDRGDAPGGRSRRRLWGSVAAAVGDSAVAARLGRALWSGRIARPRPLPKFGQWALTGYSAIILLFLATPSLVVIVMSFSGEDVLGFPPHSWSVRWYAAYFGDPTWLAATWVSFKIAAMSMVLALFLGTGAAYALVRGPQWLRNPGYALLLAPLMVPSVVMAIGLFGVLAAWNLLGTVLGILLAHTVLGISYVVIIVAATLMGLDRTLELASISLGASHPRTAARIVLPLIMPGLVAAGIFAFINSFDEVVVTSFIASLRIETLPLKIWEDIRYAIDPTVAAISAMLIMIPVIALPFVRRRGGPIQF